jgi:outer membrane receptor protein involved in Fe transport
VLLYATYSEGFRSGGINRARVPNIEKYRSDWVYNHEIGWKSTWLDGQLRFNGAAYMLDWDDFQFGILDFTLSNLTIIRNLGQARTFGTEFDLAWSASDRLGLTFSGSYNNTELRDSFWTSEDDRRDGLPPDAVEGSEMPFVPEWQFASSARYELSYGRFPGYVQAAVSYTGDSWSDLLVDVRQQQDAYTLVNLSTGIETESWSLDLFISNLTDERAQIDRYDPGYPSLIDTRTVTNRPRSIGIRFGQKFN